MIFTTSQTHLTSPAKYLQSKKKASSKDYAHSL